MKKEIIKKYLEQVLSGTLIGFGLSIGISLGIVGIYAFNWSGVSTVTSSTTLTAGLRNTTMGTITGAIQSLESGDITISGIKTFSSPIVAPTPTTNNQLATKAYVDSAVSAAGGGSCDGTQLYIKKTKTKYGGNLGGKIGGDSKCNLEYPGYHMCNITEVTNAGYEGCLPNPDLYNVSGSDYTYIENTLNNCSNWTLSGSLSQFRVFYTTSSMWSLGGANDCSSFSISCCK